MPFYEYECVVCGKNFDEFRFYKDRDNVFHCEKKAVKLISQVHCVKDLSYNFTTEVFNNGRPTHITSSGQYKRLLKDHRLLDASMSECKKEAVIKKKGKEITTRNRVNKLVNETLSQFKKDNVNHVADKAIKMIVNK